MFYTGDLQSGINAAVQHSKLVVCFVTDGEKESQRWETDFLLDSRVAPALLHQAVLLRLKAGSIEAGYLAEIFPIPTIPALVVTKNRELKEFLACGISREDFLRRLSLVFGSAEQPGLPSSSTNNRAPSELTPQLPITRSLQQLSPLTAAPENRQNDCFSTEKRAQEIRRNETTQITATQTSTATSIPISVIEAAPVVQKRALLQSKQQRNTSEERARILKRVEDDKAERRHEAAARRAEREEARASHPILPCPESQSPRSSNTGSAILVRLLDGSTIRSQFPPNATLANEVRQWVNENSLLSKDQPYIFKHVLCPSLNRTIEAAEETQSLSDLGCRPSATLILVPVTGYSSAYVGAGGNLLSRAVSGGYGLVSGGLGMVTGMFGGFLGASGSSNNPSDDKLR